MTDYYAAARTFQFFPKFVGILITEEEDKEATTEFVAFCEKGPLLTRPIFKDMPDEQRKLYSRGTTVWGTCCGLEVISGGKAFKVADSISARLDRIARSRARELRKAAFWTDEKGNNDYLVAPDGSTTGVANMSYGPYTLPDAWLAPKSPWNGILSPDVKFVK